MCSNESIRLSNARDKKLSVKLSASTLGRCLIPGYVWFFFENGSLEPVRNYKLQGKQSSRVEVKLKLKLQLYLLLLWGPANYFLLGIDWGFLLRQCLTGISAFLSRGEGGTPLHNFIIICYKYSWRLGKIKILSPWKSVHLDTSVNLQSQAIPIIT